MQRQCAQPKVRHSIASYQLKRTGLENAGRRTTRRCLRVRRRGSNAVSIRRSSIAHLSGCLSPMDRLFAGTLLQTYANM
jgi:hypothetical protein